MCRNDSGDRLSTFDLIVGMKRIFVREKDRNENPVIARVTWDGKDWPETLVPSVSACDRQTNSIDDCGDELHHHIEVQATPDSTEHGTDETGEHFEEQLVVQYYSADGTLSDDVRIATSPKTDWVATKNTRGNQVPVWFVLRDDRGGVAWVERRVDVTK